MLQPVLLVVAVGYGLSQRLPPFDVRDTELLQMSKKLRKSDDNKAHPWQITINYQGQAKDTQDNAPKEFFTNVDNNLLERPSFSQFIAMMDNFNRKTGSIEPRVPPEQEKREISTFLTTILASRPWQTLYGFLNRKGHPYAKNPSIFRNWIEQLWFTHYSRSKGKADSSAFEHVFMGEVSMLNKNPKVY
ncbi:endoribonuclease XendoU [Ancylostoma duodenale]|uniref:Endoribonuclease XendoU n=1 Tax=Ancylostoma duodenale TaxID=51022 RepID=A0A0C2CVA9_9BILA|nr:endoribonuclease XendoU [Ancylostoma duodenale]